MNGVRQRLFAVDVLAAFKRGNCRNRVPVVGGGDADGVNVLACDDFAEIGMGLAVDLPLVVLLDALLGGVAAGGVHVADGQHADGLVVQEGLEQAPVLDAHADEAHVDHAVGGGLLGRGAGGQDHGGQCCGGRCNKGTAGQFHNSSFRVSLVSEFGSKRTPASRFMHPLARRPGNRPLPLSFAQRDARVRLRGGSMSCPRGP